MNENRDSDIRRRPHLTKEQRLPNCYKEVEKIVKSVKSCQINFKTALAKSRLRGAQFKKVYNLSLNVLKYYNYIQKIIDKLQLLKKEKFLRKEVAAVLIYELIFGNGFLPGESKAVTTVRVYEKDLMTVHQELQDCNDFSELNEIYVPRYARVHSLVTTVACVIKDLQNYGFNQIFYDADLSEEKFYQLVKSLEKSNFLIDFHFKDVLVFSQAENLTHLDLYKNGHIFLQDKASYIPVHALNPEPGTTVLDPCAAPGMKSTHIASKMKNKGILIACERDEYRFETLKETLKYGSVKISKTFCTDFTQIDPNDEVYSAVDYILLDPSCSGSGMVNRMDDITDTENSKTKERLLKLAGFQIILLKHALKFPSVKRVVYSTCSVHEEENEYVVEEVLNACGGRFKLVPVLPDCFDRGLESYEIGKMCLRTVPKKHLTNGFFVAMFERTEAHERGRKKFSGKRSKKENVEKSHDMFSQESKQQKAYELPTFKKKDKESKNKSKHNKQNQMENPKATFSESLQNSENAVKSISLPYSGSEVVDNKTNYKEQPSNNDSEAIGNYEIFDNSSLKQKKKKSKKKHSLEENINIKSKSFSGNEVVNNKNYKDQLSKNDSEVMGNYEIFDDNNLKQKKKKSKKKHSLGENINMYAQKTEHRNEVNSFQNEQEKIKESSELKLTCIKSNYLENNCLKVDKNQSNTPVKEYKKSRNSDFTPSQLDSVLVSDFSLRSENLIHVSQNEMTEKQYNYSRCKKSKKHVSKSDRSDCIVVSPDKNPNCASNDIINKEANQTVSLNTEEISINSSDQHHHHVKKKRKKHEEDKKYEKINLNFQLSNKNELQSNQDSRKSLVQNDMQLIATPTENDCIERKKRKKSKKYLADDVSVMGDTTEGKNVTEENVPIIAINPMDSFHTEVRSKNCRKIKEHYTEIELCNTLFHSSKKKKNKKEKGDKLIL